MRHLRRVEATFAHGRRYNPARRAQRQSEWCGRLFLHAQRLQLETLPITDCFSAGGMLDENDVGSTFSIGGKGHLHTQTGTTVAKDMDISVPLPPDLQAVLQRLTEVKMKPSPT